MVRQTARVILLEVVAGLVGLFILAMAVLAIRLSSGPVELSLFQNDIETALERMRNGRDVALGDVTLEWLASENRAVVIARDLEIFDTEGRLSAKAARAEILLDTGGILLGKVRPIGLVLGEGWLGVDQAEMGWSIAGDPIGSASGNRLTPRGAGQVLEVMNTALVDVLGVLREDAARVTLQTVAFENFDIVLYGADRQERTRLVEASGALERGEDGITLKVAGRSLGGENAPGGLELHVTAGPDYKVIEAQVILAETSLEAVAAVLPALDGRVTGLPSDVTLLMVANDETGLQQLSLNADAGAGSIVLGDETYTVRGINLESDYRPKEDGLVFKLNSFDIGPARGALQLKLESVLGGQGARRFDLDASTLRIDMRPQFSDPWPFTRVRATGLADPATASLSIEALSARLNDAELRASGNVSAPTDTNAEAFPFDIDLAAEVTGALGPEEVLWFWPVNQAPGARNYVATNVLAAKLSSATARIQIKADTFAQGHLADEALAVTFEAAEAAIKPLRDVPVMEGLSLVGNMTGNSLKIDFTGGAFGGWAIDKGSVHYPQLAPAGADMMVEISGSGPARNLMRIVSDSRLQLEARTGFDPDNLSGDASMAFSLTRPAKPDVPVEEYRYSGEGLVRNGGLAEAFNGLDLTKSDARISLTEKRIQISGFGEMVASPLQYDWSYKFGGTNTLADLKVTGLVNPDILNAFGVVGRAYLTGEAPIEMQARLQGTQLRQVDAAIDLLGARLDVAELGWVKPMGEPASAAIRYEAGQENATTIATLNATDAAFDGTFTLEPDGRLIAANIDRAYLEGRADITGTAQRTDNQGLLFKLNSTYLDLSRFVGGVPSLGGGSSPAAGRMGDVALEANIDKLKLREGFEARDAQLSLRSSRQGLQTLEAVGKLPNGADISAAFDASGLGDPSFLINSGDASFMANVFLGTDALEGGTLQMTGTLATGDLPTQVRMVIEDGRLKDAPFVTQILSLASIRGLSDTLSGEGVLFTTIELPLTIAGGRYNVVGARASGPALGLTANGWLTPEDGGIDIDGVLVPSFGLNSALGGLPVIGDLFISRQGEGVISLRYGIEGTLERAQVSVNPLSAVTPGVLRRIFESPADTELPEPDEDKPATPGE